MCVEHPSSPFNLTHQSSSKPNFTLYEVDYQIGVWFVSFSQELGTNGIGVPQSESETSSEEKRKTAQGPTEKPKMKERGGLGPAGIMVMAVIITVLILMLLLCCDCRKPKLSRMIRKKRL